MRSCRVVMLLRSRSISSASWLASLWCCSTLWTSSSTWAARRSRWALGLAGTALDGSSACGITRRENARSDRESERETRTRTRRIPGRYVAEDRSVQDGRELDEDEGGQAAMNSALRCCRAD